MVGDPACPTSVTAVTEKETSERNRIISNSNLS